MTKSEARMIMNIEFFLLGCGYFALLGFLYHAYNYKKSLEKWHEHCIDWSNYLMRVSLHDSDEHIKKALEIKKEFK